VNLNQALLVAMWRQRLSSPVRVTMLVLAVLGPALLAGNVRGIGLAPLGDAYPFALPEGLAGGVSAVAINSKQHLFAFQRNPSDKPQLFEFDDRHRLVRTFGEETIGHQNKAHGMAIDAEDNIWICDENGDTVEKLRKSRSGLTDAHAAGHDQQSYKTVLCCTIELASASQRQL